MMTPTELLRSARRLGGAPAPVRRFAIRAFLLAPPVEASLALLGLKRTLAWIEAVPRRRGLASPVTAAQGERIVGAVYAAHLVRGACLPRSLVQYLLHRRDGVSVRFLIGVRHGERRAIGAHAWVEATSEPNDRGFAPLYATEAA